MQDKHFLNPLDVGELLGISKNKVYELLRSENFPVISIGRLKKVPVQEFELWVKRNSNGGNDDGEN